MALSCCTRPWPVLSAGGWIMAHRIPLWVDLLVLLDGESDPGHDQERPKQIDNPVKCLDQRDSHRDEEGPHEERSENAPEQDLMLIHRRDTKGGEDQQKHEDVVD